MATIPYVNSTGALKKLLEAIQKAKPPANFSYDFMKTDMGVTERSMLSLLRRMKFVDANGVPTDLYKEFRNPSRSKNAMGKAIENAFEALYKKNEYIHNAKKEDLKATIASISGNDHDSKAVASAVATFEALKTFAAFDFKTLDGEEPNDENDVDNSSPPSPSPVSAPIPQIQTHNMGLSLGYTINLILPETTNIEVFNSIFKSLNENLLRKQ